jgi:hypothetical protein
MSGMVGLGGLAAGWRLATGPRGHEVSQWHRERRADAYVELLEVAEDVGHVVAVSYPKVEAEPPRPVPYTPSSERQARARARVAAFGSPKVRAATDRWREAADAALGFADALAHDVPHARLKREDARAAEQKARAELDQAINDDLSP